MTWKGAVKDTVIEVGSFLIIATVAVVTAIIITALATGIFTLAILGIAYYPITIIILACLIAFAMRVSINKKKCEKLMKRGLTEPLP